MTILPILVYLKTQYISILFIILYLKPSEMGSGFLFEHLLNKRNLLLPLPVMSIRFLRYLICCLSLALGVIPVCSLADEPAGLQRLSRQAAEKQISQHPYWLRLLHFHHPWESPGQWSFRSDVQNSSFFLSAQGQVDPEAELQATIQAFFQPEGEDPNQHPQCRFVARYQWLKKQLDFSGSQLPEKPCPLFERWANLAHVKSVSFVFASAYMGNPASIYGHILLKINSEGDVFSHSLLSPTFNFGAMVDGSDNPVSYALKGLFGGYTGRFSDERFYNYNHIYGETELRDLWEYELNLDDAQRRRIIYHAWEMLQAVDFDYFFSLDNCAYRLAGLVEMAWDEKQINPSFGLWSIPVNVFYRINAIENNGAPLVTSVRLIPSRQRRLLQKVALLTPSQKNWLLKITTDFEQIHNPDFGKFSETDQAHILDALIDYNQYQLAEEEPALASEQKQQLLLIRSKLPILPESKEGYASPAPPTEGTPPARFRIGSVYNSEIENSLEIGAWISFHDSIGREEGHLPNTELITLDTRIRLTEERVFLHQLTFFSLQSLEVDPIDSPLSTDWSWQVKGVVEPRDLSCRECLILNLTGGLGKTQSFASRGTYFAFLSPFLRASEEYENGYSVGIEPSLGMMIAPTEQWKFAFSWHYSGGLTGERIAEHQAQWNHRLTLSPNMDARLEISHHQATEIGLALNYYW